LASAKICTGMRAVETKSLECFTVVLVLGAAVIDVVGEACMREAVFIVRCDRCGRTVQVHGGMESAKKGALGKGWRLATAPNGAGSEDVCARCLRNNAHSIIVGGDKDAAEQGKPASGAGSE